MTNSEFTFPVGYYEFHKDQVFNFQLNRWYSLGYARFEDMKEAGQMINTFEEWKAVILKLAEYWTVEIASELDDAPDDVRARFAEIFDLYATIRPDSSLDGYHFDLSANIPLEMEGDKPGTYDVVFSPSGGG